MARLARVVAPGYPHHIIQRGNRRQQAFFSEEDYRVYLDLMSEYCQRYLLKVWAYCLMPNHVHLIAVPQSEDGLRRGIGEAHRKYTRHVNFRMGWRGHLWQWRFLSYPMDEEYLLATARYVELNPVKAGMIDLADQYPWSSAKFHTSGGTNILAEKSCLEEMVPDWRTYLSDGDDKRHAEKIKKAERTGRPVGCSRFVKELEKYLNRVLQKKKPGPRISSGRSGDN